jgi:group I intron endonuclease
MTAVCGVYAIINKINGNIYVGSSINIHRRKLRHFRYLKNGGHENTHLQNAYNKYGEDAFEFIILEKTDTDSRLTVEQKYLDMYKANANCYNICHIAGSPVAIGRVKTDSHRKKISDSIRKFYDNNPQHKEYLGSLRRGKPLSEDVKQKMKDGHERGIAHHNSKLNDIAVMEIRQKYSPHTYSFGKLAKEYGVDRKTIIRIIKRKTWAHIP